MTKQKACRLAQIEVDKLVENPIQPEGRTEEGQMVAIKASLREYGLVSPLAVAPAIGGLEGQFMIADGTRRLEAFEGDTINCLVYDDDDPLELFVILNGTRKTIGGNAWLCSYAKAPDDATRSRLLQMMPAQHRASIRRLVKMLGQDEVIVLGKDGKQSPGIVNTVSTASRLLRSIDVEVADADICRWLLGHDMQDMVNRLNKDRAMGSEIRRLHEAIVNDQRFERKQ